AVALVRRVLIHDWTAARFSALSLHDALPIFQQGPPAIFRIQTLQSGASCNAATCWASCASSWWESRLYAALIGREIPARGEGLRSEEHTSELQSRENLVCRLLLEQKKENAG